MDWAMDCSIALAWALPDEESALAVAFQDRITEQTRVFVPALWWFELANALAVAERRSRLPAATIPLLIESLAALPLLTDPLLGFEAVRRFHGLAMNSDLSAYDASYLELAQRRGLGLATLDQRLASAARESGVTVFEPEALA